MKTGARKATSKSALAARAKVLHTASLGWLEGFPLAVEDGQLRWICVPTSAPSAELRIEGRHFSRATYALNKLRSDLAPALPRLADDPDVWLSSIERRLELLKGAVHHGAALPAQIFEAKSLRDRASQLASGEPRLLPVLSALSWVHAGDPARARAALAAIQGWSGGFERLAVRLGELQAIILLLRLAQLAADHGIPRVQALVSCLFDERSHDIALDQGAQFCVQILRATGKGETTPLPGELPSGTLGRELALWCEELVRENRRTRLRMLRLFELATPLLLVERWALWWDETRRLLREAHNLLARPYNAEARRRFRSRAGEHQKAAPPVLAASGFVAALRALMAAPAAGRANQLTRVLALVPPDSLAPGRSHFLMHWSSLQPGAPESRVGALLSGFERYLSLRPVPDAELLGPWGDILPSHAKYPDTVEDELLDEPRPRRTILAAYEHVASVAKRRGGLKPNAAVKAVELFFLAGDSDLAARLLDSVCAGGRLNAYDSKKSLNLALRLCRDQPERFAEVLKALASQEAEADLPPSEWPEPVLAPLTAGELGEFVRDAIVTRQLDRLVVCLTKLMMLDAAGQQPLPHPVLGEPVTPSWIERYPLPLHPILHRLAAILDDAEEQVARWLAAAIPSRERLEREIHVLRDRLQTLAEGEHPELRRRLDNLQARLARPPAPRPARVDRLRTKLERAWGRAVLDRWEAELDARLAEALRQLLGIDAAPAWLLEPHTLSLLAAATRLDGRHRSLAFRLFRLRCGPPPWDLRDAPENRAFLESLPGLDWTVWLDGIGTKEVPIPNGRLFLALEDDPLEIFRMGGHFQTCLSPGSVNYYSVFANAADVNKRVLYARDESGKVFGRCLLAVTDSGNLLTFAAYCHDGNLGFDSICTGFAEELARRMGTSLASRGKVSVLVASNWYDDGARGLGQQFPALQEESPLRQRLATLPAAAFPGELRRALKPARLDEATLPLVLDLPELGERPELAVPLLRLVADCPSLPDSSLVSAAFLGVRAGSADLVRRLFLSRLYDYHLHQFAAWIDPRATDLLLQLDPASLLNVLRRTRRKSVRRWVEEVNGDRLERAAEALEALYRPSQARLLWQRLDDSSEVVTNEEQRQRARAALRARS